MLWARSTRSSRLCQARIRSRSKVHRHRLVQSPPHGSPLPGDGINFHLAFRHLPAGIPVCDPDQPLFPGSLLGIVQGKRLGAGPRHGPEGGGVHISPTPRSSPGRPFRAHPRNAARPANRRQRRYFFIQALHSVDTSDARWAIVTVYSMVSFVFCLIFGQSAWSNSGSWSTVWMA